MILWYLDRFGLPNQYRNLWTKLLVLNGLSPLKVQTMALHKELGGTLLTKHGNRKAPTWDPLRGPEIESKMREHVEKYKPSVIVLSSPESLVAVGVHPDFATLSALRGSVYDFDGIPMLVMLPISAWTSKVSPKEIGAANYGESDHEMFEAKTERDETKATDTIIESPVPNEPIKTSTDAVDFDSWLKDRPAEVQSRRPQQAAPQIGENVESGADRFWYEPVMVPVGKFSLRADTAKLSRIYHGKSGELFDAYK